MLSFNDVQRLILSDIRGFDAPDLPISEREMAELEEMLFACEDDEISGEIISLLVHADE